MRKKYRAFISYSHRDKRWGDWLHKSLETYSVPKSLIGQISQRGEVIPARVYPVFRDREELPTAVDLGETIRDALAESMYLIVICSPHSATSRWVNEEILAYKRLGGEGRILALIVAGEPNAADATKGIESHEECFPQALKLRMNESGELGEERTEPIAADARHDKDGKKDALLKLLAGVLGVNYDDLRQRDRLRKQRRQRITLTVSASMAVAFAGLAGVAFLKSQEAERQRNVAERETVAARKQLARSYFLQGVTRLRAEDSRGLAYLAESLKVQPADNPALAICLMALGSQSWPLYAGSISGASVSTDDPPEELLRECALQFARDDRGRHLLLITPELSNGKPRVARFDIPPRGDPGLWMQEDTKIPSDLGWNLEGIQGGLVLRDKESRAISPKVFWGGDGIAGAPLAWSSFAGEHWLASLKLRLLQYESFEKTLVQCTALLWRWGDTRPNFQPLLAAEFEIVKAKASVPAKSWKRILSIMQESNLEGDEDTIQHLAISPNAKWIAICRRFSILEVFEVMSGDRVAYIERGPIVGTSHTVAWSADSTRLATVFGRSRDTGGMLHVIGPAVDEVTGEATWREIRDTGWTVGYGHVHPDENGTLFYAEMDEGVRIFDAATGGEAFDVFFGLRFFGYPGSSLIGDPFIQECLNRRTAPVWLPDLARFLSGWELNNQGLLQPVPFVEKAWPALGARIRDAEEPGAVWRWAEHLAELAEKIYIH